MHTDASGSLWQTLSDCYMVLNLQRLACRSIHWILDRGSVAGVHHTQVGTLGLLSRNGFQSKHLNEHISRLQAALQEVGG
ncbi:MAG: hypothetical protein SNJ84_06935 [Verrucomicrobiia bacterium]